MNLAHAPGHVPEHAPDSIPPSSASFLHRTQRLERSEDLAAEGYVVARVIPLESTDDEATDRLAPGTLREAIEGAIEIALTRRGALPPAVEVGSDAMSTGLDQVFRVRTLGATGLCIVLPVLSRLTNESEMLEPADSQALQIWRKLATTEPVILLFDALDRGVSMLSPQPLSNLFEQAMAAPEPTSPGWLAQPGAEGPADPPNLMSATVTHDEPLAAPVKQSEPSGQRGTIIGSDPLAGLDLYEEHDLLEEELQPEASLIEPRPVSEEQAHKEPFASTATVKLTPPQRPKQTNLFDDVDGWAPQDRAPQDEAWTESLEQQSEPSTPPLAHDEAASNPFGSPIGLLDDDHSPPPSAKTASSTLGSFTAASFEDAAANPITLDEPFAAHDEREHASDEESLHVEDEREPALDPNDSSPWLVSDVEPSSRASHDHLAVHVDALNRAHGPKPIRAVEQLYRDHYVPLVSAIGHGCQHEGVVAAVESWSQSFEKSYSDGYTRMRVTGRRPQMVLDAPDVAARIGRANGARHVQLLLIDSMRYDLGRLVADRLHERIGQRAVCVDETLLWSALPTLTPTQLRLLARGPRGLKERLQTEEEQHALVQRGRSITTLRRIRIGPRHLLKLDVVEARLREAGPAYPERMAGLSNEVTSIVERFIETLAPRTLLTIFGDHGFRLDPGTVHGTAAAHQGGASPEEVLVPCQSWLIGDVH